MADDVRWMRPGIERSWQYGRLASLPADVVEIDAKHGAGRYSIKRAFVERKVLGPRGGVRWEPL